MNREVLLKVRDIVETNPERHHQEWWLSGFFDNCGVGPAGPGDLFDEPVPADGLRDYALEPMPAVPVDEDNPVCGTTGCVAGWICLLTSPPLSLVDDSNIYVPGIQPGGEFTDVRDREYTKYSIEYWAKREAGLSQSQIRWLFASFRSRAQILRGIDYLLEHEDATESDLESNVGGWLPPDSR